MPRTGFLRLAVCWYLGAVAAMCQPIPDVRCVVEDYPVRAVVAWQFPETLSKVQVVVLRDTAGASVAMFATRRGKEEELKGLTPYWSAFNPDQGGSSMGVPAITGGVACQGQSSMRAIAMMVDRGVDNSFQKEPLLGVWMGHISDNFPPGYSSPYTIETDAAWIE